MIYGNKQLAFSGLVSASFEALKEAFDMPQINWESKNCENAIKEFSELSLLVAETVLSTMLESPDVTFVMGRLPKQFVKNGIEVVSEYYQKRFNSTKYAAKKTVLFKKSFESRVSELETVWQKEARQFYKR
jgi:hypothetical protein